MRQFDFTDEECKAIAKERSLPCKLRACSDGWRFCGSSNMVKRTSGLRNCRGLHGDRARLLTSCRRRARRPCVGRGERTLQCLGATSFVTGRGVSPTPSQSGSPRRATRNRATHWYPSQPTQGATLLRDTLGLRWRKVAAIPVPPKKSVEEHAATQAVFLKDGA